uniref:C-type lectin domain-containing protein n=1 Tax=Sinocyclocheilus anshuiensis TaxID=1608454 RepID=A0A671L5C4_9TELE
MHKPSKREIKYVPVLYLMLVKGLTSRLCCSGSDSVRIRSSRAAAVCLLLLCVLLLTAVIVLCAQIFTNIDLFQTKGKNIMEERDQLLTRNKNLTEERDQLLGITTSQKRETNQLLTKITSLSGDRDWLLNKNINLTNERDELIAKNDNLIKQRDQLNQEINEIYYYISSGWKSWTESRIYCTDRGGDLIIKDNSEEQEFVVNISGYAHVWIGLTDSDVEGRWKWVDGFTLTSGFWQPGEPGEPRYSAYENCALSYTSGWIDYSCYRAFKWICETSILHTALS